MILVLTMDAPARAQLDVGKLYEEMGPFLLRVIDRLCGPGGHVDDLLQETFVVAFRKRAAFDPERAAPRTWLYGIAANLCRRYRRSAGRLAALKARFLLEQSGEAPSRPDRELEARQRTQLVQEVLQKISFKQREVFTLYELEGLEGKDIAAMLKIPEGTVWTRLHHARRRFEKLMLSRIGKGESV